MTADASDGRIYHLYRDGELARFSSGDRYRPPSLEREGFIHFSLNGQLTRSADRFYANVDDLWALEVAIDSLASPLRFETADGELFPHLFGALNLDAVTKEMPVPRDRAGRFANPFARL